MTSINELYKLKDVVKYMDEKWVISMVWYNGETNLWLYNLVLLTKDDKFYNTDDRQVEARAIPHHAVGPVLFNLNTAADMARELIRIKARKDVWENKDKPTTIVTGCTAFACGPQPAEWTAKDEAEFEAKKKAYLDLVSKE
jgi:hypothetical protein